MNHERTRCIVRGTMILALGSFLAAGASCKSNVQKQREAARNRPAPAAVEKAPAAAEPVKAGAETKKTAPAEAKHTEPVPGVAPAVEEGKKTPDKDELWKCYQEVYCAQKKGEMDKILDIYKKYGFETPQEFTRVWIEAAKDTDWVSKLANDVSKKCP